MNIHLDWELFQRIVMIGGMLWVTLWSAIKMGAKILQKIATDLSGKLTSLEHSVQNIETELKLNNKEFSLKFEALEARIRSLEIRNSRQQDS